MRDFPVFPTETGVSSLTLRQIPYTGKAYIRIQSALPEGFDAHLEQCLDFCRAAGAAEVFASGHEGLSRYPLHAAVLELRGTAWRDPEKMQNLFPVTEPTVGRFREYLNRRMAQVDCASYLEARDEQTILKSGGAYFVHADGQLLGVGWLEAGKLLALAAEPGQGECVFHSLMSIVEGQTMTLEAADTNHRALRLYQKLGFVPVGETARWYRLM